ncbi:MAG: TRAM domain-containing protein [Corynebacterium sp.]|nr:TRAM domain-containing protein [Corynebacterium sp.]
MSTEVNSVIKIEILRPAHQGFGIGTAEDGRVVFVADTVPGDIVDAEIISRSKSFSKAIVRGFHTWGPGRISETHLCPAAAAGAGCCDYSFIDVETQRALKKKILEDQLARITRIEETATVHALEPSVGWRIRARFQVSADGKLGLRKRNSHDLVTEHCMQMHPALYDYVVTEEPGTSLNLMVSMVDGKAVVKAGNAPVTHTIGDYAFNLRAKDFWQSHSQAPAAFNSLIVDLLGDSAPSYIWDLYGGAGALLPGLLSSHPGLKVDSVDITASHSKLPGVTFHKAPVEKWVQGSAAEGINRRRRGRVRAFSQPAGTPDVVLLDPPRSGMHKSLAGAIAAYGDAAISTIVHVGCDPAAFARDLGRWLEHGYQVRAVHLVDSFPQTHHFESFAVLHRVK